MPDAVISPTCLFLQPTADSGCLSSRRPPNSQTPDPPLLDSSVLPFLHHPLSALAPRPSVCPPVCSFRIPQSPRPELGTKAAFRIPIAALGSGPSPLPPYPPAPHVSHFTPAFCLLPSGRRPPPGSFADSPIRRFARSPAPPLPCPLAHSRFPLHATRLAGLRPSVPLSLAKATRIQNPEIRIQPLPAPARPIELPANTGSPGSRSGAPDRSRPGTRREGSMG